MKTFTFKLFLVLSLFYSLNNQAQDQKSNGLEFVFVENNIKFTKSEKDIITETITNSEREVRKLLPKLPENIKVIIEAMPRKINEVGGTTGRAQKRIPNGEVFIYISSLYPGGIKVATQASLAYTIYHEFHHLARGWTMEKNKYGPGIDIAMVNEGLAVVFGETYTNQVWEGNGIPKEVEKWVADVLELPKDANYNQWMNQHPDGRQGIGYRAGHYVIEKAIKISNKDIIELSELTPEEILKLAGY